MLPESFWNPGADERMSFDRLLNDQTVAFLVPLAKRESCSFRGWAVFVVSKLRAAGFVVECSGTPTNPHHAHVPLAEWGGYADIQSYNQLLTGCITDCRLP